MRATWILLSIVILGAISAAAETGPRFRLRGPTMGTTYTIDVPAPPAAVTADRLRAEVEELLAAIDRQISTYRPDSEISRFNASRSTAWTEVSAETSAVVSEALHISQMSKGAFDVTVGPLIDLWGFGAEGRPRRRPSPETLQAYLEEVGSQRLDVREHPPAMRKRRAELRVDLSAIGNGFGVDRIAEHIERLGIVDYLVELGGELRGRGRNSKGNAWSVAIERPEGASDEALAVVRLDGTAISTSGGYRNYFDEAGVRYGHVIDPRTGVPIGHALALVSVIDRSAMRADALATALLVLGPEDGWDLARRQGIAALFAIHDGKGFRQRRTPEFARRQID